MSFTEEVEAAAKEIHNLVNRGGNMAPRLLAQALAEDHRTLVQSTMRELILPFIGFLAEQGREGRYDLRNEGSVKLAMDLEALIEVSPHTLPFV